MGSLTKATRPRFAVTVAVLVLTIPIFVYRRSQLTALRLGEASATSFGIPVRRCDCKTLVAPMRRKRNHRAARRRRGWQVNTSAPHSRHIFWHGGAGGRRFLRNCDRIYAALL
ncbi:MULTISPECIES: iron chelate uptake ABC transporter family permease subunit [unclassified Rhizobium]|uniref:iron chelate uptake ABC transporter family permease subunit n=1 Tax=unclassified Rhizobium TaxID=2613769 RepID=UPI001FDAC810|nr:MULTISPECIES: iron chelate uptake ABC transporter family permease subunit [unclassified Rhizobium]